VFELVADGGQWQVLDPCRCQFDRKGKAIQLAADLCDERGGLRAEVQVRSHSLCTLPKQCRGRPVLCIFRMSFARRQRQLQWWHRELVLPAQPQCSSAGHKKCGLGASQHQGVDEWRCRYEVLEGVQHH
jgi:hypothetical protein